MEFILGFLLGSVSGIAGMSFLLFYGIVAVLVIALLWAISGDELSTGWATLWGVLLLVGLGLRFWSAFTIEEVGVGLAIWVLGGLVYTYFRLRSQSKRLRAFVNYLIMRGLKKNDGNYPIVLDYSCPYRGMLRGHRIYIHVNWSGGLVFEDKSAVLAWYDPKFADNRGLALSWSVFWPILFLQDITIDLIKNLQDWLKNVYQSGMSSSFGAEPSPWSWSTVARATMKFNAEAFVKYHLSA